MLHVVCVLLCVQIGSLAPSLHVPTSALIELLGTCMGLVAVAPEVLGAGLTNLASALGVEPADALELITIQPALLAAQVRDPECHLCAPHVHDVAPARRCVCSCPRW